MGVEARMTAPGALGVVELRDRLATGALDALALVEQKLDAVRGEIAAWEDVTRSTGYAG